MNGLENAKPGDVFKLGDYVCVVTKNPLRYKIIWADGSAGFYNLGDPFFTNHQWTRLIPERTLTKLQPGDVIPKWVRYLVRSKGLGTVDSRSCGVTFTVPDDKFNDYFLDPIPELPPVEPEPVRAPQFIGVVRHKKCGVPMFVSFLSNGDINGIDDRGEVYACRNPCDWERDAATAAANGITETPEFLAAFSESEARDA